MKRASVLLLLSLSVNGMFAATYEWWASALVNEEGQFGIGTYDLHGSLVRLPSYTVASAQGNLFGYLDAGSFCLKQYDRTTTPVGDDNVTFVLAFYGDIISALTIEKMTRLPLCEWGTQDCMGGVIIDDPSDFYLAFKVPESKTTDGLSRYGWYHLSISPADTNIENITLLDSGIGTYGESVLVGLGAIPEPSSALLMLLGGMLLLLRRMPRDVRVGCRSHGPPRRGGMSRCLWNGRTGQSRGNRCTCAPHGV